MAVSSLPRHNPAFQNFPPSPHYCWNGYASRDEDVRVLVFPKEEIAGTPNFYRRSMFNPFRFIGIPDTILPEQAGNPDLVHMGLGYRKFPVYVMSPEHYERDAELSPERAVPLFVGQITKMWERVFDHHAPAVIRNTVLWFFRKILGVTVRFVRFLPPKIVDSYGRRLHSNHFGGAMHIECDIEVSDLLLSYHDFFIFDLEGFFAPLDVAQQHELHKYCQERRHNDIRLAGLPSQRLSIEPAVSYTKDPNDMHRECRRAYGYGQ